MNAPHQPGNNMPNNVPREGMTPTSMLQREVEGNDMILYRSKRFFVRTANRPGQRHNPLRERTGSASSLMGASFLGQVRWLVTERQRITEEETRLLPDVETINPVRARAIPYPLILEAIIVMLGLAASVVLHAINIFNYPLYSQDEGTSMANAWAVLHGMVTPYPYTYQQTPLGWLQIAFWVKLSGGLFTFGNAINSGRVLMLIFAVASALLVYLIGNRLSGSRTAGLLAMIIFSFSPLGIIYQRQVLLENIGTFWLLLSLYLLTNGGSKLRSVVFAALALGIAILSKEVFIFFLPAMLYAAWLHSTKFQRKFTVVVFAYVTLALASAFVLLALLKGELMPSGWLPWDHQPHSSLLSTLIQQVTLPSQADTILASWNAWTHIDGIFIYVSIGAVALNLLDGFWNRLQWLLALLAIGFWLCLLRGGIAYSSYIIPMLPIMALNIAVALNAPLKWVTRHVGFDLVRALLIFSLMGALIPYDVQFVAPIFSLQATSAQNDALLWIRDNVPSNAFVVVDSTLYTDLHETGGEGVGGGAPYNNAQIYSVVAFDPAIHGGILHENWQNVDYIVADSAMLHTIDSPGGSMLLLDRALHHAILRAEFRSDTGGQPEVIQIYQVINTTQTA